MTPIAIFVYFIASCSLVVCRRVRQSPLLAPSKNRPDLDSSSSLLEARQPSAPSKPTKWKHWLSNDMVEIDKVNAEKKLRASSNVLLEPGKEHVLMAFKVGNDKTFFTSKRILFRPKGWLFSGSTKYHSLPYHSIVAYAVQTAGLIDMDMELKLWTEMPDLPFLQLEFRKGTRSEKADIFAILKLMNKVVLEPTTMTNSSLLEVTSTGSRPNIADAYHFLSNNAEEINARETERVFKTDFPILQEDETVEMAFRVGRDTTLLTSKRIMRVDVQGITGKSVEYQTIPWDCVKAFAVESAGRFDSDAEMTIWTNMPYLKKFEQDLRKGRADIVAIQRVFANRVLGTSPKPRVLPLETSGQGVVSAQQSFGSAMDILHWLGGNLSTVNAQEAERRLRSTVPVLQAGEHVELAFGKKKGRGDMTYMTTKRILFVDVKKTIFGKDKVEYMSLPYESIGAFAVETAGTLDLDSEFKVWTTIQPPPPPGGDPPPPPPPGLSMLDVDLRRGTDIFGIQKLLYARVLGVGALQSSFLEQDSTSEPPNPTDILHWLGNNAAEIDPRQADHKFRNSVPILQSGETVAKAFKTYRDVTLLTSTRVLIVDVQGLTGKKVEYRSIAYMSIGGFGVQSAGTFDSDAEFRLYTTLPWMAIVKQDLRRGTSNLAEIQGFFCSRILDTSSSSAFLQVASAGPGAVGSALDWLGNNARKIDVREAQAKLQTNPPILQPGETLKLAYKVGKDTTMFTTHRILVVDVDDMDFFTRKVEYRSISYISAMSFSVETAGSAFDRDEEIEVYTDLPYLSYFKQDIAKGNNDIFDVQKLLAEKTLVDF